jgi:predicted nucleic acid-binding protein
MVADYRKGAGDRKTAVRKLAETPALVKHFHNVKMMPTRSQMNVTLLALTPEIVQTSAEVRKSVGLLTNDSLLVASMRTHALTKLATANGDFDHVGSCITLTVIKIGHCLEK